MKSPLDEMDILRKNLKIRLLIIINFKSKNKIDATSPGEVSDFVLLKFHSPIAL